MDNEKIISIAVVVSALDEEYQYNIICSINRYAREHNVNISYFSAFCGTIGSRRFDIGESSVYNMINFKKFDGAILMTNTFSNAEIRERLVNRVKIAEIPTIIFESDDYPEFYNIKIDNFAVMKKLVNHIIQHHGAKKINYVSGPIVNPEAKARYDAFIAAMEENDLPVEERRIYHGNFFSYDGMLAVNDFVESGLPLPDAFICANDSMALTVMSSLEELGYNVPGDVMVAGFDNTSSAENSVPSMTSVRRPNTVGYRACEIICALVRGEEQPKTTFLDAEPVFRESCGCGSSGEDLIRDIANYKKSTNQRIEKTNTNVYMLNRLIAGLAESATPAQNFSIIESFIRELDCDKFCLCLTEDWQSNYTVASGVGDHGVYSTYMTAPLIYEKGERRSVSYFPSSDIFPEPFITGGNISYFLPLHFSERCLGYYIMTNCDFPIRSLLVQTLTMSISNSIENVRKLFHINKAMEELNRLYVMDPLCNIYNRNGFMSIAEDMFKDSVARRQRVMLSFIDMDGLKFINDNYGHNEGDFAIQHLAKVIKECSDNNSVCARIGGDEFVIFTVNVNKDDDKLISERLTKALEELNNSVDKPYEISASVGSIITVAGRRETLYSIIEQADDKMYEIKKLKKNARKSERLTDLLPKDQG